MFWLIFSLSILGGFHIIWFTYCFIQKFRSDYYEFESIRKPLYYRTLQYVMCICLGLLIGGQI